MTLPEAFAAVQEAGAVLVLDPAGPKLRGRVPGPVVEALRMHRDRVAACLKLREIHKAMGFSEADVLFIERAFLSDQVAEVRIVSLPPFEERPS